MTKLLLYETNKQTNTISDIKALKKIKQGSELESDGEGPLDWVLGRK